MALGTLILNASRFERHQAASYAAAAVPSETMCRQTLTTPDGRERHRRFYLAVLISRDLRPNSRSVMSGIVDSGPEGGHGNADANDPLRKSRPLHSKLSILRGKGCRNSFYNLITLKRPIVDGCRAKGRCPLPAPGAQSHEAKACLEQRSKRDRSCRRCNNLCRIDQPCAVRTT